MVAPIAGVTAVLAFEPDEEECRKLSSQSARNSPWSKCLFQPAALAGGETQATLYALSSPVNSSLRMPNPAFVRRYGMKGYELNQTIPLKTRSLDSVIFDLLGGGDPWGEFLKIDCQGGTHEILEGAERTLAERTVAIFAEVEFFEMYAGEKLFSEVELFLRNRGFSFYGFELHFRSSRLLDKRTSAGRERTFWADAVFFKDPLAGGAWKGPFPERAQHVLFVCALLLEYFDFALQLSLETWAKGEEADRIRSLVARRSALRASHASQEALALFEAVRAHPDEAVLHVGRFVDRRRHLSDYDDVV
ncbi:MAG: hypothetical protein A3I06_15785 [Candidatus Lindowbacteria bacterium RIFCSPLOWO2_02_FULL_62_12]|nr:MAG: hypothetical protein A3I06_15785 [Candidatus Lindowbacteria bacterium RIFCSPLOWO2_02_FULL_62_12]